MPAIEGPAPNSDVIFVFGARPITDGYDLNFAGTVAGAVFAPNLAPAMFSGCVLACLESLSVDVTGTPFSVTSFNVTTRRLQLEGPASPAQLEEVLQRAIYLNRAPDTNVDSIQIEVCVNTHVATSKCFINIGVPVLSRCMTE